MSEKFKKIKELCRTRWVERHDAFLDFLKLLMVYIEGIDQNDGNNWNRESHGDAYSLLLALQKFSFIVSLAITRVAITKPLNGQVQGSYNDIARAYSNIELVKNR